MKLMYILTNCACGTGVVDHMWASRTSQRGQMAPTVAERQIPVVALLTQAKMCPIMILKIYILLNIYI